uniref:Uncharacterized protein n=1 Tax=Micrurus spixii TaxID=129469 RepID=A0A2D4NBU2_9SAUR
MKTNTGPKTTHDATTNLPHQTQTQTHPIDKRQPLPRNQTTATSPSATPAEPQTKKTDICHEHIARPQTRSQTKAWNVTSQPPAQDTISQHSGVAPLNPKMLQHS